jgi:hypothetical protein
MQLNAEDKAWALKVKERDGFKCVVCGSANHLNSHHIVSRAVKALKYDLNCGITLCVLHHQFSHILSAHKNPFVFVIWLQKNRPEQYAYLVNSLSLPNIGLTTK